MTTKANGTGPLSLREVQRAAVVDAVEDGYQRVVLYNALTLLEMQGYITFRDGIIKPARRLHEAVTLYRATIEARGSEAAD